MKVLMKSLDEIKLYPQHSCHLPIEMVFFGYIFLWFLTLTINPKSSRQNSGRQSKTDVYRAEQFTVPHVINDTWDSIAMLSLPRIRKPFPMMTGSG